MFKSLEQRCLDTNDTNDRHALLLLVLAKESSLYFDKHSNFAGGKHSAPRVDSSTYLDDRQKCFPRF